MDGVTSPYGENELQFWDNLCNWNSFWLSKFVMLFMRLLESSFCFLISIFLLFSFLCVGFYFWYNMVVCCLLLVCFPNKNSLSFSFCDILCFLGLVENFLPVCLMYVMLHCLYLSLYMLLRLFLSVVSILLLFIWKNP